MSEQTFPETSEPLPDNAYSAAATVRLPETAQEAATAPRPGFLASLTVGDALFGLVALLAAILRLTNLPAIPLSPAEAQVALNTWQFWQPGDAGSAALAAFANSGSAAYFSFTSLLMPLLGSSDTIMRLVPALFGVALVLLPWLWRKHLGLGGALVTSLLLAVSPTLAITSRTVGGQAIALFAGLLLLIAAHRYLTEGAPRWLNTTAAALGLGLAAGALFYSFLLTLGLAWLVQALAGPALVTERPRPGRAAWRRAALWGLVTFLISGTLFFWNLAGLGAAANGLGQWLTAFRLQGQLLDWLSPILILMRYELLVLLLGVGALAWATWHNQPLPTFLVYWFTAAVLLALLQWGQPANTLLVTIAAYLLIGLWANHIFTTAPDPTAEQTLPLPVRLGKGILLVFLLVVGGIVYFNLGRYLRISAYDATQMGHLWLALVALIFAVAVINLARTWEKTVASQATLAAILVIFMLYSWGTAWWLTHRAANDPRERWVAEASDNGLQLLQRVLTEVSRQSTNSDEGLDIVSAVDSPALRWYLRHYPAAMFGETIPAGTQSRIVITPAGQEAVALGSDYFGADFGHLRPSAGPTPDQPTSVSDTLRWWLFHQSPLPITPETIIVWVRSDLAHGS